MASSPSTAHLRPVRRLMAGAGVFALAAGGLLAIGGPANAAQPAEPVVFDVGGFYEWTVPAGVTEVSVRVEGASGGKGGGTNGGAGGLGAVLEGTMPVSEGQEFAINVAEAGEDVYAVPESDDDYDDGLAHVPGDGGSGYTFGGDGGLGSILARPGAGGGGSSSFGALVDDPDTVVVAAGGAGGAGRGVFGFCFGGDGGDAGEDGKAPRDDETAAPEGDPEFGLPCLAEGDGGLVNDSDSGDGGDGESVLFLGGGGGGGGAGFFGDGVSGGGGGESGSLTSEDDDDPASPDGSTGELDGVFGLGGGGGGGAGGGSSFGVLTGAVESLGDAGDGSVTITYSVEYLTSTTLAVDPAAATFGDDVVVTASVENLTTDAVPGGDVVLVVEQPLGATSAFAAVEPITVPLVDGEAVFTIEGGLLAAGDYHLSAVYQPTPVSPFAGSEADATLEVAFAPTTTLLVVDPTTVQEGEETVLTATVTAPVGIVPTGDIAFYYDDVFLGYETLGPNQNSLDVAVEFAPVGTAVLTARYLGDAGFAPSVSNPVDFTVTAAPTPPPTPRPTPTPTGGAKPSGLANTGSGAAAILPWSLLLLTGGALVAGAAGVVRVRSRRD